ncbi:MAG TPA: FmdB family zinc ribbon protein [Ramlibacter sp.]|jgi:putative FmdB family regulatory protein|nr:FmdB family zinc ribbon protein [Ramlibacter sp.]
MPIYAYKCGSCGHAKDVLQKVSDAPLTVCPSCGADRFAKQITAAGFQLKGSGWYATDFRNGNSAAPATAKADDKPAEAAKSDGKSDSKTDSTPAAPKTDAPSASAGGCGASCACH